MANPGSQNQWCGWPLRTHTKAALHTQLDVLAMDEGKELAAAAEVRVASRAVRWAVYAAVCTCSILHRSHARVNWYHERPIKNRRKWG